MKWRLVAVISALAFAAHAHLRFPAVKAERWIELRLDEDPIRIGYRIGYGTELAKRERKAADTDGDGEVVAVEGNTALDAKTKALLESLSVCTGRSLEELECKTLEPRDVELVEAQGWVPGASGHLHFAWRLRLDVRAAELGAIRLEDGWQLPEVEISDVRIQPPRHAPLSSAGEGGRPSGVAAGFTWIEVRRGHGPRTVVASWPPRPRARWPLVVLGALLVASGALAWIYARRKSAARAG